MRRTSDLLLSLLIPASILLHLAFAPYTKVEESFNIQAIHDILTYGIPYKDVDRQLRQHYDHVTFSGAVPRTFVGSLALAAASWPWIWIREAFSLEISRQAIVRAVLGLFNAYCLISFRNRVAKTFGRHAANWFVLFQAGQFHLMYYASRTLPNTFAFGLTTLVSRNLLPLAGRSPSSRSSRQRQSSALVLLTATTIVLRSELAILLASYTIYMFLHPSYRLTIPSIIFSGLLGGLIGLGLSVPIDTFFWRSPTPLWSEFAAFKFNVLSSKASEWGTSPFHFYFTSSLPRLLFNPLLLFLLPFTFTVPILRRPALDILAPNLLYITIYSFQPHKEWRFIVYTIPPLSAVASAGASWIWIRRGKNIVYRVLALIMVASVLAAFVASAGMCAISSWSYPGGEALARLHEIGRQSTERGLQTVHMDTLACMTGVTRFGQQRAPELAAGSEVGHPLWVYDKTEDEATLSDRAFWDRMDFALAEAPEKVLGAWDVIDTVDGFAGLKILRPGSDMRSSDGEAAAFGLEDVRRAAAQCVVASRTKSERWRAVGDLYAAVTELVRRHLTRGWWVQVRMEPKIRILKRLDKSIEGAREEEARRERVRDEEKPALSREEAAAAAAAPLVGQEAQDAAAQLEREAIGNAENCEVCG